MKLDIVGLIKRRRPLAPSSTSAVDLASTAVNRPRLDFPVLTREHIAGARLFANRTDLIESIGPEHRRIVAEIGVGLGDFSDVLIRTLRPELFVAVDNFRLHEQIELWGRSTREIFGDGTHLEYYQARFAGRDDRVRIEEGLSWEVLSRYPDEHFDLIYIDAAHDYDGVKRDAQQAVRTLRPDGVLVFNDYIMYDHLIEVPYGVVQNVNELVVQQSWYVVALALQQHLFCDIALCRRPAGSASDLG